MQQKTFNFFYAFLLAILGLGATLMAEDITLTTYYPAPYGAYDELTTTGNTYLATTSGNVGIGTTVPATLLEVSATNSVAPAATSGTTQSGGGRIRLSDLLNVAILDIGLSGNAGAWIQSTNRSNLATNYPLLLNPNGGNVGIGTTNPQADLDVNGTIAVSGTSGVSGTFTSADAVPKTITVTNGIITGIN